MVFGPLWKRVSKGKLWGWMVVRDSWWWNGSGQGSRGWNGETGRQRGKQPLSGTGCEAWEILGLTWYRSFYVSYRYSNLKLSSFSLYKASPVCLKENSCFYRYFIGGLYDLHGCKSEKNPQPVFYIPRKTTGKSSFCKSVKSDVIYIPGSEHVYTPLPYRICSPYISST